MAEPHAQAGPHLAEIAKLDAVVDDFACEMKAKLARKALEGFRGWDDPGMYHDLRLRLARLTRRWFAWNDAQEIDIATGIEICPISTALEERRESAYG